MVCYTGLHYLAPVRLVRLPQHTLNWSVELGQAAHAQQNLVCWRKMFLDSFHNRREHILVEENDAFKVELRAEQVKEHVLAVAFVELTASVSQFVEHGEGLARV